MEWYFFTRGKHRKETKSLIPATEIINRLRKERGKSEVHS